MYVGSVYHKFFSVQGSPLNRFNTFLSSSLSVWVLLNFRAIRASSIISRYSSLLLSTTHYFTALLHWRGLKKIPILAVDDRRLREEEPRERNRHGCKTFDRGQGHMICSWWTEKRWKMLWQTSIMHWKRKSSNSSLENLVTKPNQSYWVLTHWRMHNT